MKTCFEIAKNITSESVENILFLKHKIKDVLKLETLNFKVSSFNFGWASKTIDLIIENESRLYHINILSNDLFVLPPDCKTPMNCKCYQA